MRRSGPTSRSLVAYARGCALVRAAAGDRLLVPGVVLVAGGLGLALLRNGSIVRHWNWEEVGRIDADGCAPGPDGRYMQLVELHAAGIDHIFLLPAQQVHGLLAAMPDRLSRREQAWRHPRGRLAAIDAALSGASRVSVAGSRSVGSAIAVVATCVASVVGSFASLAAASRSVVRSLARSRPAELGRSVLARSPASALATGAAALLVVAGAGAAGLAGHSRGARPPAAVHLLQASSARPEARTQGQGAQPGGVLDTPVMARLLQELQAQNHAPLHLAPATAPPAPAPPSLAGAPPLRSHEVFGFAPYWNLASEGSFDVAEMTTIAYFSVDINGDGTADESGSGWNGYSSQDFADLVTRAHHAGDRVVLTATCFDQGALDLLASDTRADRTLASTLVGLVRAKNLDGVNLDFEGEGPGDRQGLDVMASIVSAAVTAADPHWQLTMDTYASSAGDPNGFYDVAGLAPYVDAFFVMAYDMNDPSIPSPTAPLSAGTGFNDAEALSQYVAVVNRSKIVLGVPYYGYDWPTSGPGAGDPATGPPQAITFGQVEALGRPTYWDPSTETAWTSYRTGGQWHQVWFDDPTSLSLKAQLANVYQIRGLGIWALGMDGNDPAMLAALAGTAPVQKDSLAGPAGATPTYSTAAGPSKTAAPGGAPASTPATDGSPTSTEAPPTSSTGSGGAPTTSTISPAGASTGSSSPLTAGSAIAAGPPESP